MTTFTAEDVAAKRQLDKWLKRHKLSNRQAAALLGVTPTTVSRWLDENTKRGRKIPLAKFLSAVLAQIEPEIEQQSK